MRSFLLVCGLILTGCTTHTGPALKQWTIPEQIEIAKERNQLPEKSILRAVLDDWERMRRGLK